MARPLTIRDDDILNAARELFLEQGIRATTAAIAARAQVSSGILFKRFRTKEGLFQAAMHRPTDPVFVLPDTLDNRVGKRTVQENLLEFGVDVVERALKFIPVMMMDWSGSRHCVEKSSDELVRGAPDRAKMRASVLAAYLGREARLGRVARQDFDAVAQTFIGALWHYAFLSVVGGGAAAGARTHRAEIKKIVSVVWPGLDPKRGH